jgi:hypothetical protein
MPALMALGERRKAERWSEDQIEERGWTGWTQLERISPPS